MISFVPLRLNHLPLLHGWLSRPHLTKWWTRGKVYTLEEIAKMYGSRARGEDITKGFVLERDGQPAGYAQFSPRGESAGVDLFLADEGTGQGAEALSAFLAAEVFPRFRVAVVDPVKGNARAMAVYARAGFKKQSETADKIVLTAERP